MDDEFGGGRRADDFVYEFKGEVGREVVLRLELVESAGALVTGLLVRLVVKIQCCLSQ